MSDSGQKKIAVLISGNGSNLQSIINHVNKSTISASIACVISNVKNAYGLQRAQQSKIQTHTIEHNHYASRELFEQELIKTLMVYNVDVIALAGFMRVLSETFVNKYQNKVLNIHPSLLPKYPGLHTHQRALENNDKEHGCSVHFATDELDGGPLVIQAKVNVKKEDTQESLAARVLEKEHIIYPLAIKWFCEDKLKCLNNETYFENRRINQPILFNNGYLRELK